MGDIYKAFVLDSSVLQYLPYAIYTFGKNLVVIPSCTVKELERITLDKHGEAMENARIFGIILDELARNGNLRAGIDLPMGGRVIVCGKEEESALQVAASMNQDERYSSLSIIIVSQNPYFRVMANILGLRAEAFALPCVDSGYDGRCCLYLSDEELHTFSTDGALLLDPGTYHATSYDGSPLNEHYQPTVNEYILLHRAADPDAPPILGQFNGKAVVALKNYTENNRIKLLDVKPKNIGQVFAMNALLAPAEEIPLVILKGPACTGKTFLSLATALTQTQNTLWGGMGDYQKIVLTGPFVHSENGIISKKGIEGDSVVPELCGLTANLEQFINQLNTKYNHCIGTSKLTMAGLIRQGVIEFQTMIYHMGQPICNQFIIADATQNTTVKQIQSMISRIGEGSKLVLLGNPDQIDHPYLDKQNNGLMYASQHMRGSKLCSQMTFAETECIRSPIANEAIFRMASKGVAG